MRAVRSEERERGEGKRKGECRESGVNKEKRERKKSAGKRDRERREKEEQSIKNIDKRGDCRRCHSTSIEEGRGRGRTMREGRGEEEDRLQRKRQY